MSKLSADLLRQTLPDHGGRIFIGYSGGVDSQVLLHLCASVREYRDRVTAVYVHHGLQAEADAWAVHCRYSAEELGVAFVELKVDAQAKKRQSPEEAARIARYSALKQLLQDGDVLLLAQHREDQLETVLLQLFRGAGVAGLAAMPEKMAFGRGVLVRPLLDVGKRSILDYAAEHRLEWVEDPSNKSCDYDRNFLRNEILPLLKERWPALDKTVARSARHCGDAADLLDELADDLLSCCNFDEQTLSSEALMALDDNKRHLVLRRWFLSLGLKMPSESVVNTVFSELLGAAPDADPELRTQAHVLKRFHGKLYCLAENSLVKEPLQDWPNQSEILTRQNGYCLQRIQAETGIPVKLWEASDVTVRLRQGGEKIRLPGRSGQHALKKLFQEKAIPPWQRDLVPLIYLDDKLAAVAGLWVAEACYSGGGEPCYEIVWRWAE